MAWSWRYEAADGSAVQAEGAPESFPNQGDAESWLGEGWRELREQGVHQVVLLEDDREVYGPMGLDPA